RRPPCGDPGGRTVVVRARAGAGHPGRGRHGDRRADCRRHHRGARPPPRRPGVRGHRRQAGRAGGRGPPRAIPLARPAVTRARAALLLLPIAALALLPVAVGPPAGATSRPQGVPADRHALVLMMAGAPFDQVLSVPAFRQLAREGGAGLMTTAVPGQDQETSSYLTIGA